MKCIIGLGNPGKQYEMTRHNIGFRVMDALGKDLNADFKPKFKAEFAMVNVKGEKVILLKPLTYMNLSGEAVRACLDFYDIDVDDILVIYDDMDLPVGQLRLREKGSAGGHNGIKSLIQHLHTQAFKRIRIGIDKHPLMDRKDFVLSKFSKDEETVLKDSIDKAVSACRDFVSMNFVDVMTRYNTHDKNKV